MQIPDSPAAVSFKKNTETIFATVAFDGKAVSVETSQKTCLDVQNSKGFADKVYEYLTGLVYHISTHVKLFFDFDGYRIYADFYFL